MEDLFIYLINNIGGLLLFLSPYIVAISVPALVLVLKRRNIQNKVAFFVLAFLAPLAFLYIISLLPIPVPHGITQISGVGILVIFVIPYFALSLVSAFLLARFFKKQGAGG